MIVGGRTSTESKSKYNAKSYATHLYSYRKNSEFGERVRGFKAQKGTSLNYLITKLLAEHWEVDAPMPHMDNDTWTTIETKGANQMDNESLKRHVKERIRKCLDESMKLGEESLTKETVMSEAYTKHMNNILGRMDAYNDILDFLRVDTP